MALDHDLGLGGDFQRDGLAIDELDLAAAQQARELVFRQRVGHRRHGGEDGAGIGAHDSGGGQGLAFLGPQRR